MAFTLCLNTSTIRPQPLLEKIRLASEHGFAAIELWLVDVMDHVRDGGTVRDVAKAVADAGLHVPSTIAMKGWVEADEASYPAALEDVRRRMDLAVQLGSPLIVATPSLGPADLDLVARRYRDLLRLGREIGVRPVMEYLGFCQSVYRIDQLWHVVQGADDPDGVVVLDAFHTYRGGSRQEDMRLIPGERIAHYHLDDAPASPPRETQMDPDRVMPGDGAIDLKQEIAILRELGYSGAISLELFNPGLWEQDPNDVLRLGIDRMRQLLDH